jgi:hypothetical protein
LSTLARNLLLEPFCSREETLLLLVEFLHSGCGGTRFLSIVIDVGRIGRIWVGVLQFHLCQHIYKVNPFFLSSRGEKSALANLASEQLFAITETLESGFRPLDEFLDLGLDFGLELELGLSDIGLGDDIIVLFLLGGK